MRRSWLGLQLLLSCALLLAIFAVEGRCSKEEESSSEEDGHYEKRHHHAEECREKRHHHEEEECCCMKRHHHEEEECCWVKRHHHEDEECCRVHHHEEEECCCTKRHHHKHIDCCKKKHSHAEEESGEKKHPHGKKESGEKKHPHGKDEAGRKKHSHGKKESCKKKHSHAEEESGEKKDSRKEEQQEEEAVGKKHPKKRRPFLEDVEEESSELSDIFKELAEDERQRIKNLAAQTSDAVPYHRKRQVIAHFNRGSRGPYYKQLEDGQMEYEKAYGVMIYVQMLLGPTNCTKAKKDEVAGVEYSRDYLEKERCQLLPQLKQEQHNCTFGIFLDVRTEKKAVVSRECIIIPGIKKLSKSLKSLLS